MEMRKIYIGADSAGYSLKCEVIPYLKSKGYEVIDCGTAYTEKKLIAQRRRSYAKVRNCRRCG